MMLDEVLKKSITDIKTNVMEYRKTQMMDAALGICGESAEFILEFAGTVDKSKMLIEAGDLIWYVYSLADSINCMNGLVKPSTVSRDIAINLAYMDETKNIPPLMLLTTACEIADYVKKYTIKGIDINKDELMTKVNALQYLIGKMLGWYNLTTYDAIESLIEKLSKRYPDGYENKEVR